MEAARFDLRLIGPMRLTVDGAERPLPRSRKSRALLAYLAVLRRPVRRERLTELFWDLPDDPRGSLRWSLSRLRDALGGARDILCADRDEVALGIPEAAVDWHRLRAAAAGTGDAAGSAFAGEFLEGLDLPRCESFEAWCVAQREDVRQWRCKLLSRLAAGGEAEAALPHARAWVESDPWSPAAWERLVDLLRACGRSPEAERQRELALARLAQAGAVVPNGLRCPAAPAPESAPVRQDIRFCAAPDGTSLAYAVAGDGPPIVKTANWMSHLAHDWDSPIWKHWLTEFTRGRTLLRYDERGNGLSDWDANLSFEAFVEDLESVVAAAGPERFDLLGMSQGAAVAIAFAVRHPERVRRMVLLGGFARGWALRAPPDEVARRQAMLTLTLDGWGLDNPAFRQMFTSLMLPEGSPEHQSWFNDLQRRTTSPANARRIQIVNSTIDVAELLPNVSVPTLVAHARDDAMVGFDCGREIARAIPGARFLALDSPNHILLETEPAWARFAQAVRDFLD